MLTGRFTDVNDFREEKHLDENEQVFPSKEIVINSSQ
jgi:hypothetical protein